MAYMLQQYVLQVQTNRSLKKIWVCHCFIFLFFIFFFISKTNAVPISPTIQDICTAKIEKISVTQGSGQTGESFPQSGWRSVEKLPDYWSKEWKNNQKSAWYSIDWTYLCPTNTHTAQQLVIENINMAAQIFLNDELIYQDQYLTDPISRNWHLPQQWLLPAASLKSGKNQLIIHVIGVPTQKAGLGRLYIGSPQKMQPIYQHHLTEKRTLTILNIMINLVIALLCILVWLFDRRNKSFIWFSILGCFWTMYLIIAMYPKPIFHLNNLQVDQLHLIVFCFYVTFSCIAIWRFAKQKFIVVERALWAFVAISSMTILFTPEHFQPVIHQVIFVLAVLIFVLKCITYPYIAYRSKVPEGYFLAFVQISFLPIAFNDAYYMMTLEGSVLSPYTAPITSLFIGFVLALRLSNNAKRIENFNKTLEDTVRNAQSELSTLLNQQHALALDNVKLQERIHLAQDLHDGIGGSIVRSIILVDHHEHIEKQQMLSILKLLRNDLRQVIDTSASLDTKTPENPILWVASIRHRFVQIFEEMDIQSTWTVAPTWVITPTPLQCLTLLRVAEEALTNIVKHSHANCVEVKLHQHQQQLILEIHDNGQGFDPLLVQQGFHVGLQSMQVRVQRLRGHFEIQSIPTSTLIRVILYL